MSKDVSAAGKKYQQDLYEHRGQRHNDLWWDDISIAWIDGYSEAEQDMKERSNAAFNNGVWFAVDYLVRWVDDPTAAVQICNEANISRKEARKLWKESAMPDDLGKMKNFLREENFAKEE